MIITDLDSHRQFAILRRERASQEWDLYWHYNELPAEIDWGSWLRTQAQYGYDAGALWNLYDGSFFQVEAGMQLVQFDSVELADKAAAVLRGNVTRVQRSSGAPAALVVTDGEDKLRSLLLRAQIVPAAVGPFMIFLPNLEDA